MERLRNTSAHTLILQTCTACETCFSPTTGACAVGSCSCISWCRLCLLACTRCSPFAMCDRLVVLLRTSDVKIRRHFLKLFLREIWPVRTPNCDVIRAFLRSGCLVVLFFFLSPAHVAFSRKKGGSLRYFPVGYCCCVPPHCECGAYLNHAHLLLPQKKIIKKSIRSWLASYHHDSSTPTPTFSPYHI